MPHEHDDNRYMPPPGDFIREELKKRGWSQLDLARILGRPVTHINQIIQGNRGLTPETAVALSLVFDTEPDVWLRREFEYRLFLKREAAGHSLENNPEHESVRRRRRLYELAPIKELQKRGWIRPGDDTEAIERDVLKLLEIDSTDLGPTVQVAMRKTDPHAALTPAQRAWCCRVRQIARSLLVAEYKPERLPACDRELRKIAAYSQEVRKVPTILSAYGIRYVVLEPLPGSKIDGMATWLDDESPVIGMSIRHDRIDNFWHTLAHELSHIRHGDRFSADVFGDASDDEGRPSGPAPEIEARADREAVAMLVPQDEMESFIRRVAPLYSKERINQLANRIKIHPGIIVGQLHKRGEIGWAANREMLAKVRHSITPVALTDGWGHSIDPRAIE